MTRPTDSLGLPETQPRFLSTWAPRAPIFVLAATVVLAALAYATVAQLVRTPVVNPDELRYTLAARALAGGEWVNLRGEEYGLGPIYPLTLAPIVASTDDTETAYGLFRMANAFFFALAAVPTYILARRLLAPWWSVAVAAASLAIPSSIYTALVMTESVSYLAASVALLTVVLALERASVPRQLLMLLAVAVAYLARPQFAALLVAFLLGSLLLWALETGRPAFRAAAARLWPTLGGIALVAALFVGRLLVTSAAPRESLGGYSDLWRGYDPMSVARFVVYHLAGWELYLLVIPFVVAPVVVARQLSEARRGAEREGAFAAAFLTANAVLLLIVAAFASTPYGYHELHDRYLFYVAPLWLVAFAVWLRDGLPRPLRWTALGATLALALPAVTPFGLVAGNIVFESVPTALWSWVWTHVEGTPHLDGRRVLGIVVIVLTGTAILVPRRLWPVLPLLVGSGLLFGSALAWDRIIDVPYAFVAADTRHRTWVDDALGDDARVTKLYVSPTTCPYTELTRHAFFLTEFFNRAVDRAAGVGDSTSDGLPRERVEVGPGGRFLLADGNPFVARYVLTQQEVVLRGRRIVQGTGGDLVLWETNGPVRLADPGADPNDLVSAECG